MPRNMSFALTTAQVQDRSKTVTRRLGWQFLKPGDVLQPVVKAQGIPKGGTVEKVGGLVRVVSVRRERLDAIDRMDVMREGFRTMSAEEFIEMFCRHMRPCGQSWTVTRIEFEYL